MSATPHTWRQRWEFLVKYIKNPKEIGAVTPSSRWLVRAMMEAAPIEDANVIVEFGPGTGVFTDGILARMKPDAHLLVFETHQDFLESLQARIKDPRVEFIGASAAELKSILASRNLPAIDRVISGLPFNAFPPELSNAILTATRDCMHNDSIFATFQHTPFQGGLFRTIFTRVHVTEVVWRNLPPAAIYRCQI